MNKKLGIKYCVLLEIRAEDSKQADALYKALEIENKRYSRSEIIVKQNIKANSIKVRIVATDKTALFASTNAIYTLLRALDIT